MAQPPSCPISVIGPQFVAPSQLELIVETHAPGNLVITDTDHKILLRGPKPGMKDASVPRVDGDVLADNGNKGVTTGMPQQPMQAVSGNAVQDDIADSTFHRKRLVLDPDYRPLLLLQEKNLSAHQRWNVFRGESKSDSDLIFTCKHKHISQWFKMQVNVFLANKCSSEDNYDFNIKGSWSDTNCTIHMQESSTPIAQMHKFQPKKNAKLAKGKYMITVNPNVDYAFVVALIAILDGMNNEEKKTSNAHVVGGVVDVLGNLASA
ncbi:LURP1-like domain-containing protein [Artemisia annua]|uniref:LURP1-like domain-containing protein n=1 Tax=Artemisia annua TaxID=35608 RepID=A0A2U1PE95_ARTAN|nr:LURP1-like domain-containing protein [Artemisia annua]